PLITTRGLKERDMIKIAGWINLVVNEVKKWSDLDFEKFENKVKKSGLIKTVAREVKKLCLAHPLAF
ncbi:MAG: hypothetical protein WCI04_06900, partial [archaeon]